MVDCTTDNLGTKICADLDEPQDGVCNIYTCTDVGGTPTWVENTEEYCACRSEVIQYIPYFLIGIGVLALISGMR